MLHVIVSFRFDQITRIKTKCNLFNCILYKNVKLQLLLLNITISIEYAYIKAPQNKQLLKFPKEIVKHIQMYKKIVIIYSFLFYFIEHLKTSLLLHLTAVKLILH